MQCGYFPEMRVTQHKKGLPLNIQKGNKALLYQYVVIIYLNSEQLAQQSKSECHLRLRV